MRPDFGAASREREPRHANYGSLDKRDDAMTRVLQTHGPANDLTVWRGFYLRTKERENNTEKIVMKVSTFFAALAVMLALAPAAQAHEHHRHLYRMRNEAADGAQQNFFSGWTASATRLGSQLGGRPAAWCGWEMRQLVGSDPGPTFNLARNWARWGAPGPAGVGAVVVWPHHVGKIVGQQNGMWVIQSGNDGHAVRSRARSIAGAIAIRWG
jgi:hypothetical protein